MTVVGKIIESGIAVISFENPPVNALNHPTRAALVEALQDATRDATVRAIVLGGLPEFFSAGADITELGKPAMMQRPSLNDLIDMIEQAPKPVVAAIDGACFGGGFELALGCHYRIASRSARFGLPEIKLGLIPGAGGTQRLPRLAGPQRSLELILTGNPVAVEYFASTAVLDLVCPANAVEAAKKWILEGHVTPPPPPPRVRDRTIDANDLREHCRVAREKVRPEAPQELPALKAIESIQAAGGPFPAGERLEREAFAALLNSSQSKALRHAFFAERTAARVPDLPADTPVRPITVVAVIGAGTMGTGIAMACLDAGLQVRLLELNAEAAARGVANIRKLYEGAITKGRVTAEEVDKRIKQLQTAADYDAISGVDLAIEAVFEDLDAKKSVLRKLDAALKPGAILASNTSTLNLDVLAAATKRPQDVIGLHFFSPAHVMRLLEIVRGKMTAPDVLATALNLSKRIRKVPVVAGVCDGFIGNRMFEQYTREALQMLEEGATPAQVDCAIERFGFAMGPFRVHDLAGNDIGWAIRKRRYVEYPQLKYSRVGDLLCELGRFGQKTSAGWYDYQPGNRTAMESPVVATMLERHRASLGVKPRTVPENEIVERLLRALSDEGQTLLREGIASRASDIDVVYLFGYGFPRWRGGPMFYAEETSGAIAAPTAIPATAQATPARRMVCHCCVSI